MEPAEYWKRQFETFVKAAMDAGYVFSCGKDGYKAEHRPEIAKELCRLDAEDTALRQQSECSNCGHGLQHDWCFCANCAEPTPWMPKPPDDLAEPEPCPKASLCPTCAELREEIRELTAGEVSAAEYCCGSIKQALVAERDSLRDWVAATQKEFCICAAIRMPNGEVIHGHRHNHCYDVVRARENANRLDIIAAEQGFVTSAGRFVGRKEGMILQRASGKPSAYHREGQYVGDCLFSEDLY
jgi:hypothetical protein